MSYFRNMKFINEQKQYFVAIEQGVPVRGKRSINNLPNNWNDVPRSFSRSWKDCRKTQYHS